MEPNCVTEWPLTKEQLQMLAANVAEHKEMERDAARYRWLVSNGAPGIHTFVTGIHPVDRSAARVSKQEFDDALDLLMGVTT